MDRARVLLADDRAEFLSLVQQLLETEFDVIKTFENAEAVVEQVGELNPDLLVLDITMPGLSGIEAARRLSAGKEKRKIIFLTVHKDPDYLRSALAVGALGYVVKDRLASDLIPAMHEALAGRRFVSSTIPQEQNP